MFQLVTSTTDILEELLFSYIYICIYFKPFSEMIYTNIRIRNFLSFSLRQCLDYSVNLCNLQYFLMSVVKVEVNDLILVRNPEFYQLERNFVIAAILVKGVIKCFMVCINFACFK